MDTPLQSALDRLSRLPPQTRTQIRTGVTLRKKRSGQTVLTLHYSAIPERDPNTPEGARWRARERGLYSSESRWKKEQEIDPHAAGGEHVFGAIFSEHYSKVVISDPYWAPDPRWDVVMAMDHGKTNATCLLKAYITRVEIDPATGKERPPDVYIAGEFYSMKRTGWDNNVDQNVREMLKMPDIERARWRVADPAIFEDTQAQGAGEYTSVYREYQKAGFVAMRPYDGVRLDTVFVEWMLSGFWSGIAQGRKPRCFIVCRNPMDRPQPGLHPYDCPNLIWELKRARRVEMTARQLLTRNPSESIIDKDNHARDAFKYLTGRIKKGAPIPLHEEMTTQLEGLDQTTRLIKVRHLFSDAVREGKIDWTGEAKKISADHINAWPTLM